MRKFTLFFALLTVLTAFSGCHRAEIIPENTRWKKFTYKEYNGFLYTSRYNEKIHCFLCFDYAGVKGFARLEHPCTEEQYQTLPEKLTASLEAAYSGDCEEPDLSEYPDLSMYLSFVISTDELHFIWYNLGLEETPFP